MNFTGYTNEQRFRVSWIADPTSQVTASESMTWSEAQMLKTSLVNVSASWVEEWNGWEWVKV